MVRFGRQGVHNGTNRLWFRIHTICLLSLAHDVRILADFVQPAGKANSSVLEYRLRSTLSIMHDLFRGRPLIGLLPHYSKYVKQQRLTNYKSRLRTFRRPRSPWSSASTDTGPGRSWSGPRTTRTDYNTSRHGHWPHVGRSSAGKSHQSRSHPTTMWPPNETECMTQRFSVKFSARGCFIFLVQMLSEDERTHVPAKRKNQ